MDHKFGPQASIAASKPLTPINSAGYINQLSNGATATHDEVTRITKMTSTKQWKPKGKALYDKED
jgi:hypothetical protein